MFLLSRRSDHQFFVGGPRGFIITTLLGIVGAIFAIWLGQRTGCAVVGEPRL